MPIMLIHGDMDTVVPVTVGRAWAEAMKSVPMKTYEYIEVPGGDHGSVIGSSGGDLRVLREAFPMTARPPRYVAGGLLRRCS